MTLKSYISIFFSLIFLGKFLLMDSRILLNFTDAGTISYVKPFCEKQQVKYQDELTGDILEEEAPSSSLSLDFFCNVSYKFENFQWEIPFIPEETKQDSLHRYFLPEAAGDRFYPPPRV